MSLDKDWDSIRSERNFRATDAGMGILRITLLFGSAAIALALIAVPVLDGKGHSQFARSGELDTMSTGSIGQRAVYTLRKSVLQASPTSICIIRENGSRSGDC